MVRASAAKVEGPGIKSQLGQHFSSVAWVDCQLEHLQRKWKVLGLSPSWVNTFQKCGMGLLAFRASAAKVEGPTFKSWLGQHFSKVLLGLIGGQSIRCKSGRSWVQVLAGSILFKSVAWVDWQLEYLPRKWKVLGSSPGWVNTFQKCGMG